MAPDATIQFTSSSQIPVTQWPCNVLGGSDIGTFTSSTAEDNGLLCSSHLLKIYNSVKEICVTKYKATMQPHEMNILFSV